MSTHVLWSLLAAKFPAMCGRATLAMLVSSTSIKAANDTTTPMIQGFAFGRQIAWSMPRVPAPALIALSQQARLKGRV